MSSDHQSMLGLVNQPNLDGKWPENETLNHMKLNQQVIDCAHVCGMRACRTREVFN